MSVNQSNYFRIVKQLSEKNCTLVAVSKTMPIEDIRGLYDLGQRDFGENYVQEMEEKHGQLPKDIRWHFIGHLQTNKVKYIAPFVHLIQSVDSEKLLREVHKQAAKNNRIINVLLQIHIAQEETKFGLDESELKELVNGPVTELPNIRIAGLMGMASLTENMDQVKQEFRHLRQVYDWLAGSQIPNVECQTLSMGMSGDYELAIQEGGNMVRIGSLLFGARN